MSFLSGNWLQHTTRQNRSGFVSKQQLANNQQTIQSKTLIAQPAKVTLPPQPPANPQPDPVINPTADPAVQIAKIQSKVTDGPTNDGSRIDLPPDEVHNKPDHDVPYKELLLPGAIIAYAIYNKK